MNSSTHITMNVIDLRQKLRRSAMSKLNSETAAERRKAADRRQQAIDSSQAEAETKRIWLTPGERTLIEDLYLLEDK